MKSSAHPNKRINTQKEKSDKKSTIKSEGKSEIEAESVKINLETASQKPGPSARDGVSVVEGKSIQPNTPNTEE